MSSSLKALAIRLAPQLIALAVILLLNFIMFPQFFNVVIQNDRLYGSLIDQYVATESQGLKRRSEAQTP